MRSHGTEMHSRWSELLCKSPGAVTNLACSKNGKEPLWLVFGVQGQHDIREVSRVWLYEILRL